MKKIAIISVMKGSAIDKLALMVKKYNPHLDITVFPFHAKRHSEQDLKDFEKVAKDADLIDFEYWRNFEVLIEKFPWLKEKKKILTHHNPYDLDKVAPAHFDEVVVKNATQYGVMPSSVLIPHAVDLEYMKLNQSYNWEDRIIGMVAFRMESSKGILEVAQVCKKLNYSMLLVGHISDPEYYQQILDTGVGIEVRLDISEKELYKAYCDMSVLVCNSKDNFESGPMPVLEAMAVGVPVLTRKVGLVKDIFDGENMAVRNGERSDIEDLERELKAFVEDKERRKKIRKNGWNTARNFSAKKMASQYGRLYNRILFGEKYPLVSVITPVFNRKKELADIMIALNHQTYKNIEFVCCDDNSDDGLESIVREVAKNVEYPVKYINTKREGYNLAMARNMGVIEADGKYLMFLDSRFIPQEDTIETFLKYAENQSEKFWFFGNKGSGKRSFVENFSFIKRRDLIKAGMFCERINKYGGMSQELRERFEEQGFAFQYLEEVRAKEILTATKWEKRTEEINEMKHLIYRLNL